MCLGAQCLALEAGGSEGGCTDLPWGLAPVPHDHPPVKVPSVHSPDNLSIQLRIYLHFTHPLSILEILEMPFLSPCRRKHLSLFNKFLSCYLFCIEAVQASFSHFTVLFILCYLKAICKNSSSFTLYMYVCVCVCYH